MKLAWTSAIAIGLGWGCAASGSVVSSDGPKSQQRLQQVMTERTVLQRQLASAPPEHRSDCEVSAGDCLMTVAERRGNLVSLHGLSSCDHFPDADRKDECVGAQLKDKGHGGELTEYYAFENWCLTKVSACTSARAEQARLAALEERFTERQKQLEISSEGVSAWNALELTRARVDYLRSTLPPNATEICADQTDVADCSARFEAEQKKLHDRLRLNEYDGPNATAAYAALKQIEASCQQPELECLSVALASYGVFPESRKWVDRNLALLAQRQQLTSLVPAAVQANCLTDPQQAHQPNIVEAYVTYAREPVLYFRTQLDEAFLALHQAQVSCLTDKTRVPQAGRSSSAAASHAKSG